MRPVAEAMEPRILYSADVASGLLLASDQTPIAENRTLDAGGEYAAPAAATAVAPQTAQGMAAAYTATPLTFETNAGQAASGVDFVARGSGYGIALSGGSVELTVSQDGSPRTVQMNLVGSNSGVAAKPEDLLAAKSNYLVGNDPSGWLTGIANYGSVSYQDVYSGVDVRYYGTQRQLEYDFLVKPGADASLIHMGFNGAQASVDANGDLLLKVGDGQQTIRFKAPVSYQDGLLGRQAVASAYQIRDDGTVGFVIGDYDHTRLLVIDPVLDYASYFGGTGNETALGVAVDSTGAVYITGRTTSTFGTAIGGTGGAGDVYVAKFSADLSTLIYSTRIGGSGDEQGNSIAVDSTGNASVTGWTKSSNFPTAAAAQSAISGSQDAFIFRLNAAGSGLAFSTFLGGLSGTDEGMGIAVDGSGNVYATGQRSQALVPVLSGLGGAALGGSDAFVVKYDAAGTVQYSRFFGGSASDYAVAIAVDASGNAYIVGQSDSTNLPMVNANDSTVQSDEGFIAKINAAGSSVLYSSFVGGSKKDFVTAVAVDSSGKAFVTGTTEGKNSSQFQVTSNAFQTTNSGVKQSGFVRVYDTGLSGSASLLYSSFLGGNVGTGPGSGDTPTGIAIDSLGRAVVVGRTDSSDFPVTGDAYSSTNSSSGPDGATFLVVLTPSGTGSADLVYGTFFGVANSTGSIAMAGGKAVFLAATNTNGLATTGAAQSARAGGSDAVVVSFTVVPNAAPVIAGAAAVTAVGEDAVSNPGTLVSALIAGQTTDADVGALTGIAVTGLVTTNGTWEYSLNGGTSWNVFSVPSSAAATLLASDALTRVRFVPNANFAGTVSGGLSFRAWDRTSGTAGSTADTTTNGGTTAFSSAIASSGITVTAVNDAPVRSAGTVSNLTVAEDSGLTSLGLGSLAYSPGGGTDETGQILSYSVTAIPAASLGSIVLADGTTVVSVGSYSLAQLQGMQFKAAANANGGPATFSWSATDNGGTASGGVNVLAESLTITVTSVNDAPVRSAGTVSNLTVAEDSGLTSLGLGSLAYSPGGGTDETGQILSYSVTAIPAASLGSIVLADGTTVVSVGSYSLAQLQGMQFKAAANANGGPATFSWSATDNGGTASGGVNVLAESLTITVTSVNDAPVRSGGIVSDLQTATNAPTVSLNLGGLAYGPGGGGDESAQTLIFRVTAVPAAALGDVVLADGTTVVTVNTSYSLAELQGMKFTPTASAGTATFAWTIQDNGGTAGGGVDTLGESLQISVTVGPNSAPALTGSGNFPPVLEDSTGGAGTLVSSLTAGYVSDADSGALAGIAVTAVDSSQGNWQFSVDGGTNWSAIGAPSSTSSLLLAADANTFVRFVPGADFNGTVTSALTFRAWDRTSGTAGTTADSSVNGGATAFSTATATASLAVTAVNDAPVRNAGTVSNLTVAEDGGLTSLGLGSLAYSPGGGTDETGQILSYSVTAIPAASLGSIVLADGTTVVSVGSYSLAQLQGMQFKAAANANGGPATFSWSATDNGGTASGGVNVLAESLTITVTSVNDAPVRSAGTVSNLTVAEDSGLTSLGLGSLAYSPGGGTDETGQILSYSVTAIPAASLGSIVLADGTTVVSVGSYSLAQLQGMQFKAAANANGGPATFSWSATDNGGTASGGVNVLAESLTITVTSVNDAPVRSAGTVSNLTVAEDSGLTSLGLGSLAYSPGGGTDETGQILSYSVTAIPAASLGSIVLADGTTVVSVGSYSLAQLQGMQFKAAANANGGPATFSWSATDNGGTASGGVNVLAESLTITATSVNDAPVRTGGTVANLTVAEDAAVTSLGLGSLAYGAGGGADEAGQTLGYSVTAVPLASLGSIVLADGTTVVSVGSYSLAQLQGMQFRAAADANGGPVTFSWSAADNGGTAGGGLDTLAESLTITVTSVNDAPVRSAGTVTNLSVAEDSGLTSLGLGSLAYSPGGGTDETGQILSYSVTAIPAASLGSIVLADGTTVVSVGSYSLAQLQGMQFKAAANANGGPATFSWSATDNGGAGGVVNESVAVTVTPAAAQPAVLPPAPAPAPPPPPVLPPTPTPLPPVVTPAVAKPVATAGSAVGADDGGGGASAASGAGEGDAAGPTGAQNSSQPPGLAGAALTPVSFASAERRGFSLASATVVDAEATPFNLQSGAVLLSPQEVERSFRAPALLEQLDRMREEIRKDLNLDHTVAITAAGATFGVSVVYVLWLIRGGVLMGSYLSALPAWQVLDPLPVLERLKNPADEEDDSFEEFQDDRVDPLHSLRGY